jgi:hypothetical protein
MSAERLHVTTARGHRHNATIRTEQVNGEWWVQTAVDGVVLSYENLGPVDEVHPPAPRITHERRPRLKQS